MPPVLRCVSHPPRLADDPRAVASFFEFEGTREGLLPLVLAPALGCDGRSFRALAGPLLPRRVLLWNPPNRWPPERGPQAAARRLLEDVGRAGVRGRFVLGGASLGGVLAAAAALEAPERVAGLVLLGVSPAWSELWWGLRACRLLHPLLPRRTYHKWFTRILLPGRGRTDEAYQELRTQLLHRSKEYVDGVLRALVPDAGYDLRPWLPGLRVPTLVLQGDRDHVVAPTVARDWLAVPDAELHELPGGGHMSYVFRPDLVVPPLPPFLERVEEAELARAESAS